MTSLRRRDTKSHPSAAAGILCLVLLAIPAAEAVTVRVVNGLSDRRKKLLVHCKSGDDDLGVKYITAGGEDYHFSFRPNWWGTTLFWCYVAPDGNSHLSFTAWEDMDPLPSNDYSDRVWLAKDDGVYVWRRIWDVDFKFYKGWLPGRDIISPYGHIKGDD
ncbi:unnamed protein product [Linum trigynum]|uniref:S-protein homolog n=1 Tax=Linum trigynum TaxID=586398 RepID=A0AAV2FIV2_9ROSI